MFPHIVKEKSRILFFEIEAWVHIQPVTNSTEPLRFLLQAVNTTDMYVEKFKQCPALPEY